jgi:hypothetical protein
MFVLPVCGAEQEVVDEWAATHRRTVGLIGEL